MRSLYVRRTARKGHNREGVTSARCHFLKGDAVFRGAVITPNCGEAAAVQAKIARVDAMLGAPDAAKTWPAALTPS